MSKPAINPAFKADFPKLAGASKMMDAFGMPNLDMNALMDIQRKNIEALTAVNQAVFANLHSFVGRQAEMIRQSFEDTTNLVNTMMSAPTAQEKVMHHAEASRVGTEKYVAHARDAAETLAKCNNHAMETVGKRMNEGMGELHSLIKADVAA